MTPTTHLPGFLLAVPLVVIAAFVAYLHGYQDGYAERPRTEQAFREMCHSCEGTCRDISAMGGIVGVCSACLANEAIDK